jgi:hypothetical protein
VIKLALSFGTTRKLVQDVKNVGQIFRKSSDPRSAAGGYTLNAGKPGFILPKGVTGDTILHEYGHHLFAVKNNPLENIKNTADLIKHERGANQAGVEYLAKQKVPAKEVASFIQKRTGPFSVYANLHASKQPIPSAKMKLLSTDSVSKADNFLENLKKIPADPANIGQQLQLQRLANKWTKKTAPDLYKSFKQEIQNVGPSPL